MKIYDSYLPTPKVNRNSILYAKISKALKLIMLQHVHTGRSIFVNAVNKLVKVNHTKNIIMID